MKNWQVIEGDSLKVLPTLAENSVDAVVTDPPYELGFMGKKWDASGIGFSVELWAECLRVLKPGGHLLAFGGSRTYHRMACAIEDAGFDIRDQLLWLYGSGFPKSLDVSKAIDAKAGAVREVVKEGTPPPVSFKTGTFDNRGPNSFGNGPITAPATDSARQWSGWGTALKPAHEPIVMARKPLTGTVAANVQEWGTGAVNVDGCRVGDEEVFTSAHQTLCDGIKFGKSKPFPASEIRIGRWPANLLLDGSPEVEAIFPNDGKRSASRYFYTAKANRTDRDGGCDVLPMKARPTMGSGIGRQPDQSKPNNRNTHPTVKPTELMRYLCRLVTPPGGLILDPFNGSGSTGKAAALEGFRYIGIELQPEYANIARQRISHAARGEL